MNGSLERLSRRVLSVSIASLIVVQTPVAGQSANGLAIQVLEANAGQNVISQELPPIKVRVMDRTGRALPGASVTFAAPEDGSSGRFLPDSSQITVTTDTDGIATAPRFRTNSTLGDYGIQVVASYRDSVSRVVIPQSNVLKKKSSNKKLFILSAAIGGAAAAALVSKGGSSGPAAPALNALASPTVSVGGTSPAIAVAPAGTNSVLTTSAGSTSSSSTATSSSTAASTAVAVEPPSSAKCKTSPLSSKKTSCR